ncbi:MAG: hypothetical protein AB7H85_02935 [Dehalococcoidia bacterium]
MSELSKRIGRAQRREVSGGMGFAAAKREQPKAMVLAAMVATAEQAREALDAGADCVLVEGAEAATAAAVIATLAKNAAGAALTTLDEAGASALHEAGCDFVVSTLEGTSSAAVDTERMGQLVAVSSEISDTTLRTLSPLGFDALFVEGKPSAPTLAAQLELVRLASLSGLPLAVNVAANATMAELRALRDSGAAVAVAPSGASAGEIAALTEALRAVPAPRRQSRGGDIALVPSSAAHAEEEDEHDHEDDD